MKKAVRMTCLISICTLMLTLCGCSDKKDNMILQAKEQSLEQSMMSSATDLEMYRGLSDSDIDKYIGTIETYKKNNTITEEKAEITKELMTEWHEIEGDIGTFKGFGEFDFDSAGKTYTATLTINYSNRDVDLVYVVSKDDFEVTGANIEIIYSLGEKMHTAALNTVMGILIVFIMLVLMSIVIYAFNLIPYLRHLLRANKDEKKIEITNFEDDDTDTYDDKPADDTQLIAIITAAITAYTGMSGDDFVVRSIKRKF